MTTKYSDSGRRQIIFEIVEANFNDQLIEDKSKFGEITYYGYFNIKFIISKQVILTLRIQFTLTLNITTMKQIKSVANLQLVKDDSNCIKINDCMNLLTSTVKLCTNSSCSAFEQYLNIHANTTYYIKQQLDNVSSFLDQPTIYIKGENFLRMVPHLSTTLLKSESAIVIKFRLDFIYANAIDTMQFIVDSLVFINSQQLSPTQHLELAHSVAVSELYYCIFVGYVGNGIGNSRMSVCGNCTDELLYQTFNQICMAVKLGCTSDESVVHGKCMKNSCTTIYQPRLKSINFSSSIDLEGKDIIVTLYFDDNELDGLMQKDNSGSCLMYKLIVFQNLLFSQGKELIEKQIESTYVSERKKRKWVFLITEDEFSNALVEDSLNSDKIYSGYYSYQFYFDYEMLLTYNLNFKIQIPSNGSSSVFTSRLIQGKSTCNSYNKCISTATSDLKFCSTQDCTETLETKNFIQNEDIYLIQTITHIGFEDWGLNLLQVEIQGHNIQRTVAAKVIYQEKGRIIIKLSINITQSRNLTIAVNSELISPNKLFLNRILVADGLNSAQANQQSQSFCLKQTDTSICDDSDSSNIIPSFRLLLLLLLFNSIL